LIKKLISCVAQGPSYVNFGSGGGGTSPILVLGVVLFIIDLALIGIEINSTLFS
jgi:hypothetical protein